MNSSNGRASHRQAPTQDTPINQDILNNSDRQRDEEQAPVGERPSDFAPSSSKAAYYRKWITILMAGLLVVFGISVVSQLWQEGSQDVNQTTPESINP